MGEELLLNKKKGPTENQETRKQLKIRIKYTGPDGCKRSFVAIHVPKVSTRHKDTGIDSACKGFLGKHGRDVFEPRSDLLLKTPPPSFNLEAKQEAANELSFKKTLPIIAVFL